MKRTRILALAIVALTLLAITTQAFAGSISIAPARHTPGPHPTHEHGNGNGNGNGNQGQGHGNQGQGHGNQANSCQGQRTSWRGVVTATDLNAGTLSTTQSDNSVANFTLTSDTRIRFAGNHSATLADLQAGMNVIVFGCTDSSGAFTALSIAAVPGRPTKQHHVGVVTAYVAGTSITILAHNGQSYTYLLSPDTKILPNDRASELGVCSLVTVIFPRNRTGGDTWARGIVVHPADVRPAAFDFTGCPAVGTGTPEASETVTVTETATETATATETPTALPTDTETPTATETPTETATPTDTPTATPTP